MGGESTWRKMKLALGLNTCLDLPKTTDHDEVESTWSPSTGLHSPADVPNRMPTTPTPSSSGLSLSTTSSSSEQICAICLTSMKATDCSQAIFTAAECTHTFHLHCITSNLKHGNRVCPICRAKWKDTPVQKYSSCVPPQERQINHNVPLLFQATEPPVYDDDEQVNEKAEDAFSGDEGLEMKTYPEVSSVARSACFDNFGILINLKAPITKGNLNTRAPIDLVTMLDISGSMLGTKIALLKQAMGFVVQNLGPLDRLSVIVFSESARRLFPLRRMTEIGKQDSMKMINSLVASGYTNIAGALRKGVKVMTDRKFKNPVSSMILLSDGQDSMPNVETGYQNLLPCVEVKEDEIRIPIHTFGFGMDHDPHAMHFIAEHSGGMFSFIEAESVIQNAFAQCIGGLLSVVVQELRVEVECVHPVLHLGCIKAGSYKVSIDETRRSGSIQVGDLYAEEERDFLVEMDIPPVADSSSCDKMSLVKFRVIHKCPLRKTVVFTVGGNNEAVIISRPNATTEKQMASMEVDRQRNRLRAANAIADAQKMAERGNLAVAIAVLDDCQKQLMDTTSGRGGDPLCAGLVAELREMMDRMANQRVYESTGRAYVLSGLSSHSWQRATARGDSTETTSEILSYQTQSMVNMVNLSQTMCFSSGPSTSTVNINPITGATPPKNE